MDLARAWAHGWRLAWRAPTAPTVSLTRADGTWVRSGEAWCATLDDLHDAGATHVLFAGGEPLRHPDAPTIVAHARTRGVVLLVTSPEACTASALRALPAVDTLAVACRPKDVDAALAARRRVRRWQPSATAEILVVAEPPGTDLEPAVRRADAAGSTVFLTPTHPRTWGDPIVRRVASEPEVTALARSIRSLLAHRPAGLMGGRRFLERLPDWAAGEATLPCHAGDGLLAVDAAGRHRPCRGLPAGAAPPSACCCHFDDYDDHAFAREAPAGAFGRAVHRTLLGWWRQRQGPG